MAIGLGGLGLTSATTTASTTLQVGYPASVAEGDMLVVFVVAKTETATISTPSGWTATLPTTTVGTGAAGAGVGQLRLTIFTKEAGPGDLDPGGLVDFAVASNNTTRAAMLRYTKTSTEVWSVANGGAGSDTTSNTSFSATGSSSIDLDVDDWVLALVGITSGTTTTRPTTSPTLTGCSTPVIDAAASSTAGNDMSTVIAHGVATSDTTSAITYAGTAGTASTGGAGLIRLRATPPPPIQLTAADGLHAHTSDEVNLEQFEIAHFATTPSREPYAWGNDGLEKFYLQVEGVTWWYDGTWHSGNYQEDQIAGATEVYRGGYEYPVSAAKAAELEALGFTIRQEFRRVQLF